MNVPLHWNQNSAQFPQILHVGTGTSKCGTGTTLLLVTFCLGVLVPVRVVPVPLGHC